MRRSTRETKAPEFLTYKKSQDKAKNVSPGSDTEEEEEEEVDDVDEEIFEKKKPPKGRVRVEKGHGDTLFDQLLTSRNIKALVTDWFQNYQANKSLFLTELINFILSAAGFGQNFVAVDIDLDALNSVEITEMVTGLIADSGINAKTYPLLDKTKFKGTRKKYQNFWYELSQHFYELHGSKKIKTKAINGFDLLSELYEKILGLTTVLNSNVRDASTEAILGIAEGLLPNCSTLKEAKLVASRQLTSEDDGAGKRDRSNNPKAKAFAAQLDEYSKNLNLWNSLITRIFEDVFFHRSKDFNDDVRFTCVAHLKELILFDTEKAIKTEYLKYLARSFYDTSGSIRLEAVHILEELVDDNRIVVDLLPFVLRYMDRFIEMACGDIDPDVSLEMISVMRVMQRQGFLDSLSEEKLDLVDVIIFDPEATEDMRRESLLFMMDHTQGFDNAEEAETDRKGKRKSNEADAAEMKRRKNIAFQLETLTEFAEHNLGEAVEWSSLLAEACLATDKDVILYDWSTIISLLMREQEELITSALRPTQISILLHMLVRAAVKVTSQKMSLETGDADSHIAKSEGLVNSRWESLNNVLQMKLPQLLTRFKDDQENLSALCELLSCCDMHATAKSNVQLLQGLQDLYFTFGNEVLLTNIAKAFKRWGKSKLSSSVDLTLRQLFESLFASILESFSSLKKVIENESSQKKRKSNKKTVEINDLVHRLSSHFMRLKVLTDLFDCRLIIQQNLNDFVEKALKGALFVLDYYMTGLGHSENEVDLVESICGNALSVSMTILLRNYHDVLKFAGKAIALEDKNGELDLSEKDVNIEDIFEINVANEFRDLAASFFAIRENIVESVTIFLRYLQHSENGSDAINLENRTLVERVAILGFRFISSLRTFFPVRQNSYVGIDAFAFVPSQEVLALMKLCFDVVSFHITNQMETEEIQNSDDSSSLSAILVEKLLIPLSGSFMFDVQNLNRRQASAVLQFILHGETYIQDTVKSIAQKLRDTSLITFLEVQFVTLKTCFTEEILNPILLRLQAEENENVDEFDFLENERQIELGYDKVLAYARKFSSLLGITRPKDSGDAIDAFLKLAIEFTLTDAHHFGFSESITPFLRFIPPQKKKDFYYYAMEIIESKDDLSEEFQSQTTSPSREFSKLNAFLGSLSGTKTSKISKRKLSTSFLGNPEEETSIVSTPQKKARQSRSSDPPPSSPLTSPLKNTRGSKRNQGKKRITYNEDVDDENDDRVSEEDSELEQESSSQRKKRKQSTNTSRKKQESYATGLDVEEASDEEQTNEPWSKNSKGTRNSKGRRPSNGLATESSPLPLSGSEELKSLPSRRRFLA